MLFYLLWFTSGLFAEIPGQAEENQQSHTPPGVDIELK
jgi:hypothetical protein